MPDIMKFIIDDVAVETDFQGYLVNRDDWSEEVASVLADRDGIELTGDHWEVINFLRHHYQEYGKTPNVRSLIKMFAKAYGVDKANKERLYDLFPEGPSRQGCKIAGLPLPQDCIDLK